MKISSVLTRLACLNKVSTYLNFRGVSAQLIFQEIEIGRFARAGKETAMKMAFNGGVTLIIIFYYGSLIRESKPINIYRHSNLKIFELNGCLFERGV